MSNGLVNLDELPFSLTWNFYLNAKNKPIAATATENATPNIKIIFDPSSFIFLIDL
ncbi:MAG: hypothetical protein GWN01_05190 [Nitrosopumilaceae archaeon]|nr:hypothetical protein [Nitrosopumilaceae archaeon]NIU00338.1 hypothetical protein [Nitrosopumilaceae archaeon]NIU86740.1 hypothetical protein [Nitrosopumilaceae archaeon]NIX60940.1 hypothetical protein [Nitrosopumilaceae archaeon]